MSVCGIWAGGNTGVEPNSSEDCGDEVLMDIKPGSCPNAFNRGSRGVLPLAILSTASFDVNSIDLNSLTLSRTDGQGVTLILGAGSGLMNIVFDDVATPYVGESCECHTDEGDGLPDLMMHISSSAVSEALALNLLDIGAYVELSIQGLFMDGGAFEAVDCIWLTKGKNHRRRN